MGTYHSRRPCSVLGPPLCLALYLVLHVHNLLHPSSHPFCLRPKETEAQRGQAIRQKSQSRVKIQASTPQTRGPPGTYPTIFEESVGTWKRSGGCAEHGKAVRVWGPRKYENEQESRAGKDVRGVRGTWVLPGVVGRAGEEGRDSVPAFACVDFLSHQETPPGGATAKHACRHFIFSLNCGGLRMFTHIPWQSLCCSRSPAPERGAQRHQGLQAGGSGPDVRQRREIPAGSRVLLHPVTPQPGEWGRPECNLSTQSGQVGQGPLHSKTIS